MPQHATGGTVCEIIKSVTLTHLFKDASPWRRTWMYPAPNESFTFRSRHIPGRTGHRCCLYGGVCVLDQQSASTEGSPLAGSLGVAAVPRKATRVPIAAGAPIGASSAITHVYPSSATFLGNPYIHSSLRKLGTTSQAITHPPSGTCHKENGAGEGDSEGRETECNTKVCESPSDSKALDTETVKRMGIKDGTGSLADSQSGGQSITQSEERENKGSSFSSEPKRVQHCLNDKQLYLPLEREAHVHQSIPAQEASLDSVKSVVRRSCGATASSFSPKAVFDYLDKFVVGQTEAKRALAVALRQRWRRRQLANAPLRDQITPKNILLVGPTGVGKTEIARRLARLLDAPFIKVEATQFTEVGFHGRDVDQIIKDLTEIAVKNERRRLEQQLKSLAEYKANKIILKALLGNVPAHEEGALLRHLRMGTLDNKRVRVDIPLTSPQTTNACRGFERKQLTIREARRKLLQAQLDSMITQEMVVKSALESVQEEGIVFIDEIDKICSRPGFSYSPDASADGVQRDLLSLIEGSNVHTRFGDVSTDHILFIASGAFHTCRPKDLLCELQGRLPVKVYLHPLTESDFFHILTKTEGNLIEQNKALLGTEGIHLEVTEDAIAEVAKLAVHLNENCENIGARRLHSILDRLFEEINFTASHMDPGSVVRIDADSVRRLTLDKSEDYSRYVL